MRLSCLEVIYNKQMEHSQTVRSAIKVIVVGDEQVGKSCAIARFSSSEDPFRRSWTVFECTKAAVQVAGVSVPVEIWDLTGKKEYKQMVKSLYEGADIVLIFFSVVDASSYASAIEQWYKQVSVANSKALKVFVGNKTDLRATAAESVKVLHPTQAISKIEHELHCKYLECNALTGEGVKEVFESGVRRQLGEAGVVGPQSHNQRRKKDDQCCVLI